MDRQQRLVEDIFGAALEHSPEERAAWLDKACRRRPGIRQRVEALLLEDEGAGSFLKRPLPAFAGRAKPAEKEAERTGSIATNLSSTPQARSLQAARQARFQPGQVINRRFTVVRFIDRGGMGEVYEVEDLLLQRVHVAMKVILPEIAADASASSRFEREVLLARQVTHANLCPIYDLCLCHEPPPAFLFLTMKLLVGETLRTRLLRTEAIPRDQAVAIFHQMVAGVAAIHAAGVVHRDIKPANVMLHQLSGELRLSIMDFGLARVHESETTVATRGLVAGTPGYLAPELFEGHRPSQASDLYALGVLLHQVLTGVMPISEADSLPAEPSPALAVSDVPSAIIQAVEAFLSEDPKRRCDAFKHVQFAGADSGHLALAPAGRTAGSARPLLSRRRFLAGSAAAVCAAAGDVALRREAVENWIENLRHPLPAKRFVALLNWPTPDARIKPMLLGVIDAIAGELSRAEAFDHDLFVIAQTTLSDLTTPAQLNEAREALGANLVLAAYGEPRGNSVHLSLRVLDPQLDRPLRQAELSVRLDQQAALPSMAVRAAAKLLNVSTYSPDDRRTQPGTNSLEALAAFQAGEVLIKQPNDTGLNAAVEKYQRAVDLDPHYARASAELAQAYLISYRRGGDDTAITLGRANAEHALKEDPTSVDGHVALAWVFKLTGDLPGALREIEKALSLDPSNTLTLICQAQIYGDAEDWGRAEATYMRVLSSRPNYWLAHNELGFVLYQQGKYARAFTEFQLATLASPKNAFALSNLASLGLYMGKLREALDSAKKSFALDPSGDAALTLAVIYRAQRDYPDAIAFARKATLLAPLDALNWLELGDCYAISGAGKAEAALAYLKAMRMQEIRLETNPKNGPAWMLLALCRIKANHRGAAEGLIQKAELFQASDIDSQLCKLRILELLGRREEALSTVSQCLRKGATSFQIEHTPDLEALRNDPGYRKAIKAVQPQLHKLSSRDNRREPNELLPQICNDVRLPVAVRGVSAGEQKQIRPA